MTILKRGVLRAEVVHFDDGPDLCYIWTSSEVIGDSLDRIVIPLTSVESMIELMHDVEDISEPTVIERGDKV